MQPDGTSSPVGAPSLVGTSSPVGTSSLVDRPSPADGPSAVERGTSGAAETAHERPPLRAGSGLRGTLTLLLAGALQALSFAPGPLPGWILPFVQIASLAVLVSATLRAAGPRQAAGRAWLFGVAQFAVGVYWLVISMHRYGGLSLALSMGALLIFAAAMALYGALACALATSLLTGRMRPQQHALAQCLIAATWASAWTLFEWLRGTLFTGFTWLQGGYAHAEGMFAAWVPLLGVYGAGWLAAFAAVAAVLMLRARNLPPWDRSAAAVLGVALVTGLAGIALGSIQWGAPHGAPVLLRLVQPATPQSEKFDPARFFDEQERLQGLAARAPKSDDDRPALVLLPETSIPIFQDRVPPRVWAGWENTAMRLRAPIVLGVPLHRRDRAGVHAAQSAEQTSRHTNSAFALTAEGGVLEQDGRVWHYDKRHLVPFGEFIPAGFHWFVRAMHIPLGDFDRGHADQPVLRVAGQTLAFNICYEDTFGEEIAASVTSSAENPEGASILVNLGNLAWFGDSWALRQHLQMARLRTLETARPMVRATNTGLTAAIGPRGQVYGRLDTGHPGVLDVEVQGWQGLTPYVRTRNLPILAWSMGILLLAFVIKRRGRRRAP
ncbi:apolipoprotein N-acyltransferase [Castellaniella sp.]|uniref:apolipoprotein N-acyltransferase n=1 Tax=Castellaniella sp. TaxID=1955812 RepID=UPI003568776D